MKVSKLIRELKKMPPNLEVKYSAFDNQECEAPGGTLCLRIFDKDDFTVDEIQDKSMFEAMPSRCVIIQG